MQDIETKKKVLEEIMAFMDEKEGESLKKHPKFTAAEVVSTEPEIDAELSEKPEGEESSFDKKAGASELGDELDEDMIAELLEQYSKMK